jgi:putative ABC transport system permease protein
MLADTLRELRFELRSQKLRTALSLLGIVWGTLALLLLLAFSFGFEELFQTRARGIGDGVAIGWPERTTLPWRGFPAGRPLALQRDDILAIAERVPELAAISAEFMTQERVRRGDAVHRFTLAGVEPSYAELRALRPRVGGRFPNARDSELRARVVFLGNALAAQLFPGADPIGQQVLLRGQPFLVVGVLEPKEQDSDYSGRDEDRAFVPATTFQATFGRRLVSNFVFRAADPNAQAECSRAVTAALAARLQFDPSDTGALSLWDTTEQQRMLGWIFFGFHCMLAIGGVFTLIVGALGIAHLMQLMVARRTGEIGLKLAVGAAPARIRGEWLLQALALVAAGAVGGGALALLAILAIRASSATAVVGYPYLPLPLAIGTALLLAGIAFLAGYLPARRAASLDPVAALRGAV